MPNAIEFGALWLPTVAAGAIGTTFNYPVRPGEGQASTTQGNSMLNASSIIVLYGFHATAISGSNRTVVMTGHTGAEWSITLTVTGGLSIPRWFTVGPEGVGIKVTGGLRVQHDDLGGTSGVVAWRPLQIF